MYKSTHNQKDKRQFEPEAHASTGRVYFKEVNSPDSLVASTMVVKVLILSVKNSGEEAQENGQLDKGHLGDERTDPRMINNYSS